MSTCVSTNKLKEVEALFRLLDKELPSTSFYIVEYPIGKGAVMRDIVGRLDLQIMYRQGMGGLTTKDIALITKSRVKAEQKAKRLIQMANAGRLK